VFFVTDEPLESDLPDLLPAGYIRVPIDAIGPHPLNYNGHPDPQVVELGRSAMQFGQVKNIVVWQNKIIAGEGFWRGAKLIGMDTIDVKDVSHWPESRALAFMAVDNELAKKSNSDPQGLADIVRAAHEAGEDTPGISEQEIIDLLAAIQMEEGIDFPDASTEHEDEGKPRDYKLHVRVTDIDQLETIAAGIRQLLIDQKWSAILEV
jgi:hypothetical protein